MSNFVINENDIFKYVVGEHVELTIEDSVKHGKKLVQRIPVNIFVDEYFILYKCLESLLHYDRAFTYDSLQQLMYNNRDDILESRKVSLFEDIGDANERFDSLVHTVLTTYGDLCEEELPNYTFSGNLDLYTRNWADFRFEELLYQVEQIRNNELKIEGTTYSGREDADYFYKRSYSVIRAIEDANQDLLAESIDTSIHSAQDIEEIHNRNETQQENLGYTGIRSLDEEMLGIFKGEMITIQAGSGAGKSRLAVSFAKNLINNGKNVLFLSLEQKANRIFAMFQARHILETTQVDSISDKEIIRQSYSNAQEHVIQDSRNDLAENSELGRLRIEGRYLKADEVLMFLETVWEDFKFDAVVIDYFGLLGTNKDRYSELTNAINLLKSSCKSFRGVGFSLIVPNQLSREAEGELLKGNIEEAGIGGSESAYLFRGSDVVLTLNPKQELKEDNQMEIIVSKMRLGTNLEPIKVHTDFGHCIFSEVISDEEDEDNPF